MTDMIEAASKRVAIPFHLGQALSSKLVKPRSATPIRLPDFVEPMKAKLVDSMRPGDWIYEINFDGYRALALRGGSSKSYKDGFRLDAVKQVSNLLSDDAFGGAPP
jgi:ATP-dependent DNA ligase